MVVKMMNGYVGIDAYSKFIIQWISILDIGLSFLMNIFFSVSWRLATSSPSAEWEIVWEGGKLNFDEICNFLVTNVIIA